MDESHIQDTTRVIQLALAPAFLLSALAGLLNVFTNRLARIVDRYRDLVEKTPGAAPRLPGKASRTELGRLDRRAKLVRWALTLATGAALLITLVIGFAFLGYLLGVNFAIVVAALFIAAMLSLTVALGFFLAEVTIAIGGFEEHSAAATAAPGPAEQIAPR